MKTKFLTSISLLIIIILSIFASSCSFAQGSNYQGTKLAASTKKATPRPTVKPTKPTPKITAKPSIKPTKMPTPKPSPTPAVSKEELDKKIVDIKDTTEEINNMLEASFKNNQNMMARMLGFGDILDNIADESGKAIDYSKDFISLVEKSKNYSKLKSYSSDVEKWYNSFEERRAEIKKYKQARDIDNMNKALEKMHQTIKDYEVFLKKNIAEMK